MDDPLQDFMKNYKHPSPEKLLAIAEKIGPVRKQVEEVQMHDFLNDAHPGYYALNAAYSALSLAEALCRSAEPAPKEMNSLRLSLEYLERRLTDLT